MKELENRLEKLEQQLLEVKSKLNIEQSLYDKQLVWCWNNETHSRSLRFYDGINNGSFCSWGERSSIIYWDNIEPYEGDYPKWAKEAYKTLED